MSAQLIQQRHSKVWHVGLSHPNRGFLPACGPDMRFGLWAADDEARSVGWRTPHGICSNCAREVESAVRLIATEESRDD